MSDSLSIKKKKKKKKKEIYPLQKNILWIRLIHNYDLLFTQPRIKLSNLWEKKKT